MRKYPEMVVGTIWNTWLCTTPDKYGYWVGECKLCGHKQEIRAYAVHHDSGNAKCSQCWKRKTDHELYQVWSSMRGRCLNPNSDNYQWYGGKGIKVCERWNSFEDFLKDMGARPVGMQLDRIDSNGDYEPGNCKWSTGIEQHSNTSRNKHVICYGTRMVCSHAARVIGISSEYLSVSMRRYGWPDVDVALLPKNNIVSFLAKWLKGSCRIEFAP